MACRAPKRGGLGLCPLRVLEELRLGHPRRDALAWGRVRPAESGRSGAGACGGGGLAAPASRSFRSRRGGYPGRFFAGLWRILFGCPVAIRWSAALRGALAVRGLFPLPEHN